jgi:uracil-DNA glycosylase
MLAGCDGDLPAAWRNVLDGTDLNWRSPALDQELLPGEVILPGRKGKPLPDTPPGAHLLRAFENLDPGDVRAVILGQDPYPNPAWATGRAFEQGNLTEWSDGSRQVADSLRRIVQAMIAARTGDPSYTAGDRAWRKLMEDAGRGQLPLDPPRAFFDRLEREGVLFLNTSLTIGVADRPGAPKVCHHHFQFWAPWIHRVLRFLAARQSSHAVFLLLGRHAGGVFDRSGARMEADRAGNWERRVDAVRHFHPAAIAAEGPVFLSPPNPFCVANDRLERMGANPISW